MAVLLQQIPSYPLGGSPRNKYASVKSRVDQSDPNPAHKLQNSVKDLTIDSEQGRQINPRFSNKPSPSALIQRRKTTDFNDRFPLSTCHKKSPQARARLQKSESVDSHFSRRKPRSLDCTYPLGKNQRLPGMDSLEHKRFNRGPTFETIEEDETGVADSSELSKVTEPEAFSARVEDQVPVFAQTGSDDEDDDGSVGITGMEITSSSTETTVVLQHILALASSRDNNSGSSSSSSSSKNSGGKRTSPPASPHHSISDMAIIEEDEMEEEDEYFESPDTPQTPLTPATPGARVYTLPHPIPRLIVTDENGELVETVVEKSTVFAGSILPNPLSIPPSHTLPPTVEEEDKLESCYLSTRL